MKIQINIILSLFLLSIIPVSLQAQKKKKISKKKDYVVTISSSHGEMILVLHDETPKHKANFIKLAEEGFYDGTLFHRVINGFMIQGGDPNSKKGGDKSKIGMGGPGYTVEAEFVPSLSHIKGALAAARQGDRVNPKRASSGSQFYIVQNPMACKGLNGSYTVYGQVINGMEVIDIIASKEVNPRGNLPLEPIAITCKVDVMKKKKITKKYGYKYEK